MESTLPTATPSTLDTWLAAEAAQRARIDHGPGPGVTAPEIVARQDGLALMQSLLAGQAPYPYISGTLHFMLVEVARGRAVFQGTPRTEHLNPMGTVHGGWFATLLDSALGCAVHSTLPQGKAYTTLELKVNMIRALRPDDPRVPRVRAIGEVIHVGGQTATAEARLVGPDGKLYAHASTTCLVFDLKLPVAA